jgi:hypothetical protein
MEKNVFFKDFHIELDSSDVLFLDLLNDNSKNEYHLNNYKILLSIYKHTPKILYIKKDGFTVFALPVFIYGRVILYTPLYGLIDYSIHYFNEKTNITIEQITDCLIRYMKKYLFVKTGFFLGSYNKLNYTAKQRINIISEKSYQINLVCNIEIEKSENNDNLRQFRRLERENILYNMQNVQVTNISSLMSTFHKKTSSLGKKNINKLLLKIFFFFVINIYKKILTNSHLSTKIIKSEFKLNGEIVSEVIIREDLDKIIYEIPIYNNKYKKYGVGKLHLVSLIHHYKKEGFSVFDMGINHEGYKIKYSNCMPEYLALRKNSLICDIINYGRIITNCFI